MSRLQNLENQKNLKKCKVWKLKKLILKMDVEKHQIRMTKVHLS